MMFAKFWVAAVAAGVMGVLALSAPSAHAQPSKPPAQTTAKKTASGEKPMSHHKMSCYDYAWESQQMKDCLAKSGGKKPAPQKTSTTKKPAGKTKGKQSS